MRDKTQVNWRIKSLTLEALELERQQRGIETIPALVNSILWEAMATQRHEISKKQKEIVLPLLYREQ